MRIGIDVGGTNTDAVLMKDRDVVAWHKTPTTVDITSGIATALECLLARSNTEPSAIRVVMIGTTHFANAVIERRRLSRAACIRLGLPATESLPPMVDWPMDLRVAMGGVSHLVHGGHELDGRVLSPLDEREIQEVARRIRDDGIRSVAISAVFSPVNPEHERIAAAIVAAEVPGAHITLSSEIGRMGLLERENAAILNACLADLAGAIVTSLGAALHAVGIVAPLYVCQNDGTLMTAEAARKYPVFTFASGPTNSMRGAAFLSGLGEAVVLDIGGTTTDVGVLVRGFPREASTSVEVGGVRTNFRMPDVLSFGLGGGSEVTTAPLSIGPRSVGYELLQKALVFGGDVLTASDVAVAAGMADFGDPSRVAHLEEGFVQAALERMRRMVEEAIERVKTSAAPVPVILVGGGSILVGIDLKGASEVVRPEHHRVANAIGAAIGQVGGEIDRVVSLEKATREEVIATVKQDAIERALEGGAAPGTVQIVEVEEIPLAYLPSNAVRIRVKAVGALKLGDGSPA